MEKPSDLYLQYVTSNPVDYSPDFSLGKKHEAMCTFYLSPYKFNK